MMRTRWVGNSLFGFDWASDFKWDWTSNRGDRHSDYASIAVCRRPGYPPVFRVTLGPLCLSAAFPWSVVEESTKVPCDICRGVAWDIGLDGRAVRCPHCGHVGTRWAPRKGVS